MGSVSERTALYRLYDTEGLLLYVGIASQPEKRWQQHAFEKPWWPEVCRREVEWFDTRDAAASAEVQAIVNEAPVHNGTRAPEKLRHYQVIASALRASINSGSLVPGDKLPSEHTLAKQFDTTRSTVRKGVALLRGEGLVVSHQGKGLYVRDCSATFTISGSDPKATAADLARRMSRRQLAALAEAIATELER